MPLPLLFIGAIVVSGTAGISSGVKAGFDQNKSKKLNANTNDRLEASVFQLENARLQTRDALSALGEEKVFVLNNSMRRFVDLFTQLKNVDFRDSIGLEELQKLHIDQNILEEFTEIKGLVKNLALGGAAGAASGAITALGAYSAAGAFAHASTGTAIAALHGAAAQNATLAFFGGGSLATGGLGMAGGAAILGGLVAGPALAVMGAVVGAKASKNLDEARANAAIADADCEQYENGTIQCISIRRRAGMFYSLLARLDVALMQLNREMAEIIQNEGVDYSQFAAESKKKIASAAAVAVSIKTILDTPLLTDDGSLTETSAQVVYQLSAG